MGPVVAPSDPVASRKRKATADVGESAQKKPKLANDVSGRAGPVSAEPQSSAPKPIPANTAVKTNDTKAKAKVEDGRVKSAGSGSTKRKAKEDSPRPAKKQKGNDEPLAKGLDNFNRACFANSVIQCLDTIPELVARLQTKRRNTLKNVQLRGYTESSMKGNTRELRAAKRKVRTIFAKSRPEV